MSPKRFLSIFITMMVLFASIVIVTQIIVRNQTPETVNLKSVAMISASDGWAIGETGQHHPIILHYDGKQWTATSDFVLDQPTSLLSISMVSAKEGWIVGETSLPVSNGGSQSTSVGIIFHYLNGTWTIANGTLVPPVLRSLFILSADDIWTVGDEGTILHYDGVQWNEVTDSVIANTFSLTDVAATSNHDVWVTGTAGVILHYDGTTWKRITGKISQGEADTANFSSISMVSPDEGWIVGNRTNGSKGLVLHYQNRIWQETQTPPTKNLQSLFMITPTDGWAVGGRGEILHYSDHLWAQANAPALPGILLSDISFTSPHDGWATGTNGTILHYQNGTWIRWAKIQ